MAGIKNPITLTPEQTRKLREALSVIDDMDFEIDRMQKAGLDVTERRKTARERRRQFEGLIEVFGTD